MRIFKTRKFARFADEEGIEDEALCEAIDRADRGLIDADLGGHLIKQGVARPGQGRRGGYRVIVAYRADDRAVLLHGFPKSAQANIAANELKALEDAATAIMAMSAKAVADAIEAGAWIEVMCDGKEDRGAEVV